MSSEGISAVAPAAGEELGGRGGETWLSEGHGEKNNAANKSVCTATRFGSGRARVRRFTHFRISEPQQMRFPLVRSPPGSRAVYPSFFFAPTSFLRAFVSIWQCAARSSGMAFGYRDAFNSVPPSSSLSCTSAANGATPCL